MTVHVRLVDEEGHGCGHVAEVEDSFKSGERRFECGCGQVYVLRAKVPTAVTYTVRNITKETGGEEWVSPSIPDPRGGL